MKSNFMISFVSLMLSGSLTLSAAAQETAKSDSTVDAADYVAIARVNAALFRIQEVATGAEIQRLENPVLRYTEPVRGPTQGTVWIWGRTGRPAAVLEMIREGRKDWFCFHATSETPIQLTAQTGQTWTPKSSDLQFRPLPDAPPPADTPIGRMRQMRAFVKRFSAHQFWMNGRNEMRLLPAPLHRYEDPEQQLLDGAIFAVALGTHPEATLFLEAVTLADQPGTSWQFAVGRSGAAEMVFLYDDTEVQRLPRIETLPPSTNSYWRMILDVKDKAAP